MNFFTLLAIGVALSMDAFAVAVCKGLAMRKLSYKKAAIIGLWFGFFQGFMPLTGYILGERFERLIGTYANWVAFIILTTIGINMIREALSGCEECVDDSVGAKAMLVLAVATSIDALAVGVSFAWQHVNILMAVTIIGVTTFVFSMIGVKIGNVFGTKYKSKAELAGGVILIIIALKIIIEHLVG